MNNLLTLKQNLQEVDTLWMLSGVYEELAVNRLAKIRRSIESTRQFVADIGDVFCLIRQSALSRGFSLADKDRTVVHVVLTSNHPLTGRTERRLFERVLRDIKPDDQLVIVGRMGQAFLHLTSKKRTFLSVTLKGDLPTRVELEKLLQLVISYESVLVHYSKMQTILSQELIQADIGPASYLKTLPQAEEKYYLWEPDIPKMLHFFETQIIRLLLEQCFFEAELSRTASRLVSMTESQFRSEQIHQQLAIQVTRWQQEKWEAENQIDRRRGL